CAVLVQLVAVVMTFFPSERVSISRQSSPAPDGDRSALVEAIERYFLKTQAVPAPTRRLAAYQKLRELQFSRTAAKQLLCEWDELLRSPAGLRVPSPHDVMQLLLQAAGLEAGTLTAAAVLASSDRRLPIGETLRKAELISNAQLEVILKDQERSSQLRIGDILALRGWLNAATVDFFVERLPQLASAPSRSPIGQYLKQAGLLNDAQVESILAEQKKIANARFGELAVRKGWIKQATVDVLLEHVGVNAANTPIAVR
ncbi:MAG: hypothetical protein AAFX40_14950, partial [Cyanobacteria bacterium J06639_1]